MGVKRGGRAGEGARCDQRLSLGHDSLRKLVRSLIDTRQPRTRAPDEWSVDWSALTQASNYIVQLS